MLSAAVTAHLISVCHVSPMTVNVTLRVNARLWCPSVLTFASFLACQAVQWRHHLQQNTHGEVVNCEVQVCLSLTYQEREHVHQEKD